MSGSKEDAHLKRVVGVGGLSLSIINITIGAGIFALPAIVGIELGAFSVFAYLFCGMMMAAIMICYAEIGTRVTTTGGSYAYVVAAFGKYPGYIISWLAVFGWSILGSAALLNIIADSIAILLPVFHNPLVRSLLFFFLMGFLVITNIRGAKESVSFIKWITVIKLLPLIAIIIFGIQHIDASNLYIKQTPFPGTFSGATLVLFFAFAGFETALGASGEIKDPKRTIPLAILVGGGTVLVLYLLLQAVTLGILGSELERFKEAPLAAVANRIVAYLGGTLLAVAAAISCYGTISSDVMNTSRVLYAGAGDKLFPRFLTKVHNRYSTPHWSIVLFSLLIFVFSLIGNFGQLANLASAAILLIYLAVILAMIRLRKSDRGSSEHIFIVPGGLIIPIIGIASIVWLLSSLSEMELLLTAAFILVVSVFYIISTRILHKVSS